MRKINVGITVGIDSPTESFFTNGLKQNAVTFLETFSKCSNVGNVYFINLGSQKDLSQSPWKEYESKIVDFNGALDCIDLAVTVSVTFSGAMLEKLRSRGIKVVKHTLGSEYQHLMQNVIFGVKQTNSYRRRDYHSAVWLSPHVFESNKDLLEVVCRCPAYSAPFVWSPKFLEEHVEILKRDDGEPGLYQPREVAKRVSTFEPNIDAMKTCLTPILACEKFYRKAPELVKKASMFCVKGIKGAEALADLVVDLDIKRADKIFFESRYPIVWSLLKNTDIVLSHQRDLALNYLYFDAAWLGFPVVHNAHFVKELGFYYEGFDAEHAANLLVDVAKNFDAQKDEYLRNSREYISKFLPTNEENIRGYAELIEAAMK